jgi:hypothetical protein
MNVEPMPLETLEEIERAMQALTPEQIEELHRQSIDVQLKVDLEVGRMDDRINRALADYQSNLVRKGDLKAKTPCALAVKISDEYA